MQLPATLCYALQVKAMNGLTYDMTGIRPIALSTCSYQPHSVTSAGQGDERVDL